MIELLRQRRSIRTFTPEKIAQETIEILIEAALRTPRSLVTGHKPLGIHTDRRPGTPR
jgi:nitroreductase